MSQKIIVMADETIVCPHCAHEFPLQEGITRQTIDRHADEFDAVLRARGAELEERMAAEAQRSAMQKVAGEVARMQEQLSMAKKAEREAQAGLEQVRQEALMATSNSPTCGQSNSPGQDGRIMGRRQH